MIPKPTFFSKVASLFRREILDVQVRYVQKGDKGCIEPYYLLNGEEVDIRDQDLLAISEQEVNGRKISLTKGAIATLKLVGKRELLGNPRKIKSKLQQLDQHNVSVISTRGGTADILQKGSFSGRAQSNGDESIEVSGHFESSDGQIIDDQSSLKKPYIKDRNGGTIAHNGHIIDMPEMPFSPLRSFNQHEVRKAPITGDEVPETLLKARDINSPVELDLDEKLRNTAIAQAEQHKVRARGREHGDGIQLEPYVFADFNGKTGAIDPKRLKEAQKQSRKWTRTPLGWMEVAEQAIDQAHSMDRQLGEVYGEDKTLTGCEIPELLAQHPSESPWNVYLPKPLREKNKLLQQEADLHFHVSVVNQGSQDVLQLSPIYHQDRFKLPHADIKDSLKRDEGWIKKGNTWVELDQDAHDKIEGAIDLLGLDRQDGSAIFSAREHRNVVEVFSTIGTINREESYNHFLTKLADFTKIEHEPVPNCLRPNITLRPYQQHGYNWNMFLARFSLNGILADDMGLGKTLQTLLAIVRSKELNERRLPSLIICPTSLVHNWHDEVAKFFTGMTPIVHTGSPAQRKSQFTKMIDRCDLVITTFGLAVNDHKLLAQVAWRYVVVDEAHHIKNPGIKRTKVIKSIPGIHKLAVTGTPLQNHVGDLWSLFDFAMPGYLDKKATFESKYIKPLAQGIVDDETKQLAGELKEKTSPFVLRRMKTEVAKDLPDKVLVKRAVELTPLQVEQYRSLTESDDFKKVLSKVEQDGGGRASSQILELYTRARNICNHPIIDEHRHDRQRTDFIASAQIKDSAKLDALEELLQECKDGDHRCLIFSQSTMMLQILASFMKRWNYSFDQIDGSTKDRQSIVTRYNSDQSMFALLISTKAGGTGLNLVGADTVIFYDHDWNPANDAQAEDRAYRIGQSKNVTVYKLYSKGTIEERILERAGQKQTIADSIISVDEKGFKELTRDTLLNLFQLSD